MASIGDFINFEAYMVKRIERYHRLFHSNSKLKQMLGRYIFNRSKRICSCNIYPAAIWGKNIYLVHPDDVWIGETAVLGNNIMIYPGVKLAANFTKKPGENGRRHARISDGCILCINSTVVGPVTIGKNSIIGACALVTRDVPENTIVTGVNQYRPNPYQNVSFLAQTSEKTNRRRIMNLDLSLLKDASGREASE